MAIRLKGQASYAIAIRHFIHAINKELDDIDAEVKKLDSKMVNRQHNKFNKKIDAAMDGLLNLQKNCDEMELLDIKSAVLDFEQLFKAACISFKTEIQEHQSTMKKFAHRYDGLREAIVMAGSKSMTDFLKGSMDAKNDKLSELENNPTFPKISSILRIHELETASAKQHAQTFLVGQAEQYGESYSKEVFELLKDGESADKLNKAYYNKVKDLLSLELFGYSKDLVGRVIEPNEDGRNLMEKDLQKAADKFVSKHQEVFEQAYVESLEENIK